MVDHYIFQTCGQYIDHLNQTPNGTLGLQYDRGHVLLRQYLAHPEVQPRYGSNLESVPMLQRHLTH